MAYSYDRTKTAGGKSLWKGIQHALASFANDLAVALGRGLKGPVVDVLAPLAMNQLNAHIDMEGPNGEAITVHFGLDGDFHITGYAAVKLSGDKWDPPDEKIDFKYDSFSDPGRIASDLTKKLQKALP